MTVNHESGHVGILRMSRIAQRLHEMRITLLVVKLGTHCGE